MECVRLRVQDVDFDYRQIVVRNAKGAKDRMVPHPEALHAGDVPPTSRAIERLAVPKALKDGRSL